MAACDVGGITLPDGPIIIGGGACKTPARTKEWLSVFPVESGSYTPPPRSGNTGKVLWPATFEAFLETGAGINSYNMPNMGYDAAATELESYEGPQPLIVNIAAFSIWDYVRGVEKFSALKSVSAITLNLSCPNSGHGEIMSFVRKDVAKLLKRLDRTKQTKPIWLKFSPYSNPAELKRMAELMNRYPRLVRAVVTCNTFPNAYAGPDTIDPNNGMGGLSGRALREIARGQCRQWRQHLDPSIDVIGVGGITTGDDVIDRLHDGAKAVQITSLAHWAGTPNNFNEQLLKPETAGRLLTYLTANN